MEKVIGQSVSSRKPELLGLARELGNISEACRRLGLDRSEYYRLRRKVDCVSSHMRSPLSKSLDLEKKIIALCLEYPEWGCDRLAYYLLLKGDPISSPTVQKILIRHGLGRVKARHALTEVMRDEGRMGDRSVKKSLSLQERKTCQKTKSEDLV